MERNKPERLFKKKVYTKESASRLIDEIDAVLSKEVSIERMERDILLTKKSRLIERFF